MVSLTVILNERHTDDDTQPLKLAFTALISTGCKFLS